MSKTIFTENELKKLKDYFDWQSEAQDDILESEMWDEKVEWDDDICKKSVIIWSMVRYSENDDDEEENKYKIKVEFSDWIFDEYDPEEELIVPSFK